ncbi:MAG: AraC family transcriptional regulator [Sulfitobacter sp.]
MTDPRLGIQTLAQFSGGDGWRLALAQDRPHHMLLWFTRGQGRILLDGRRRGLGPHNAIFVPADSLFAVDAGPQMLGQIVVMPVGTSLRLPDLPRHLRVRDVHIQSELTAIIEAVHREQSQHRPLSHDALEAQVALISVWLRRQIMEEEHIPPRRNAAERLSRAFTQMIPERYKTGAPMSDYASTLGVTPTHLTRAVKAATGKTAAELLTERVVHAARCLLETTPHPARNIADHLGFRSAAYFTRFMQQHTGASPSQLRAPAAAPQAPAHANAHHR